MSIKLVHETRVISRNFMTDLVQTMVNIIGGRLKSYEKMIDNEIKKATEALTKRHPDVFNVNIRIQEFTAGALLIVVHGSVMENVK